MPNELQELAEIVRKRSLRVGDFVLSSGKKASYYLDCRMTTLDPRGAFLIASLVLAKMRELKIKADAVGGLTLGADPMAASIAVVSGIEGNPLPGFIVRKEAKGHGTQSLIEGTLSKGDRVVIVEDVVTTGGSSLQAITAVKAVGCDVRKVLAVVDREEGGREALKEQGYPLEAVFTARELMAAAT